MFDIQVTVVQLYWVVWTEIIDKKFSFEAITRDKTAEATVSSHYFQRKRRLRS